MANHREWGESLCGCCDDCSSCCCGFWCTPCLLGKNAERIDESSCCLWCCAYMCLTPVYLCWLPHYFKRRDLRLKYGLREEPCGDCPTALCCSPCALCQEARFLNRAGGQQGGYPQQGGHPQQGVYPQPGGYPQQAQPGRNY